LGSRVVGCFDFIVVVVGSWGSEAEHDSLAFLVVDIDFAENCSGCRPVPYKYTEITAAHTEN